MLVKRNEVYRPFYESDKKYNILRGGSGSGKSYAVADDVIFRTCGPVMSRTIVTRKVAATLRQSVFSLISARIYAMGLDCKFSINKSDMRFTCDNGNEIILVGLDDVNKLKSIFDPTDAWLEEADQTAQSDFEEIDRRIRTVTGRKPKITLSFNPTSVYSWIKDYFYDHDYTNGDCYELTTTYKDNEFLTPEYALTIERLQETNPSAYRVYGLGEWGVVEGVVFDSWQESDVPHGAKLLGYGLDWGYTNDPTACVAVWETPDARYYDEIFYRNGLTNPDISAMLKDAGISRYDEIVCDSAEPKSIEELHRMGWNVHPAVKGSDSIRSGISEMKTRKQFITPRSTNVKKEFAAYTYRQDKNGKWLEEPIDAFNHAIDAIRYRVTKRQNVIRVTNAASRLGL